MEEQHTQDVVPALTNMSEDNNKGASKEGSSVKQYKEGEKMLIKQLKDTSFDEDKLKELLHIALLKEYEHWLEDFFEKIKGHFDSEAFVSKKLTTPGFHKSTQQLPLTNAAIKGNIKLIDTLLNNGARIDQESDDLRGDTVFHSLARLVPTNDDEKKKIMSSFTHLADKRDNSTITAWLLKNKEDMTVLNVATISGAVDIVQYIINDQNERCIPNDDQSSYFEYHDFSLIDDVANKDRCINANNATSSGLCACCSTCCLQLRSFINGYSYSLFEMLFTCDIDTEKAVAILNIKTIKEVIEAKWNNCRRYLTLWAFIHLFIMIVLTRYAVVHSDVVVSGIQRDEEFAYKIFTTIVGFIYCIVATLAILNKLMRPNLLRHLLHNILFVILLCVFGLCSLLNFAHESVTRVLLVIIVITGWFFMAFFLMPFKLFSFFNEMLKRVFVDIFVPYTILLTLNLVSFTAAMYILLNTKVNTYSFVDVLFTMFKLMLGLTEVEEIEAANFTVLAYCIYIAFVILTFLFLMNALIAAMGATFEYYNTDAKYRQLSLEKLSVMLFLDETIFFIFSRTLLNQKLRKTKYCCCAYNKISCSKTTETPKEQTEGIYTLRISLYKNLESADNNNGDLQDKTGNKVSVLGPQKVFLTNKSGQLLATITPNKLSKGAASFKDNGTENVFDIESNSQRTIELENGESIWFALQKKDQDMDFIKTEESKVENHNEENEVNAANTFPVGSINGPEEQNETIYEETRKHAEVENPNTNSECFKTNAADHGTGNHIPNRNRDELEKQEEQNTDEGMKQPDVEENNENSKNRETDNTDDYITNKNEENIEKQEGLNSGEGIEQHEFEKCKESSKHFETNAAEYDTKNHIEIEKENTVQMQERPATLLMRDDVSSADVPPEVKSPDEIEVAYENDIRHPVDKIKQQDTKNEEKRPKRQKRKDENYMLVKKHKSTTYDHGFLCRHYGITFTSPLSPAERARLPACLKEN